MDKKSKEYDIDKIQESLKKEPKTKEEMEEYLQTMNKIFEFQEDLNKKNKTYWNSISKYQKYIKWAADIQKKYNIQQYQDILKKYNQDGADLVEQTFKDIKEKRIRFIKENLSIIKDDSIRHNANLIADIVVQVICDDLKYRDKQNEPEYMLMSSKLKADKEINKKKKKDLKNKNKENKPEKVGKSKFANKYQDRIQSIKNTEKNIERNRKRIETKKAKKAEAKKNKEKEKIETNDISYGEIKIKNYEEIRKEMLEKFNNRKR